MVILTFICEIPIMIPAWLTFKKYIWLWEHFVWLKYGNTALSLLGNLMLCENGLGIQVT